MKRIAIIDYGMCNLDSVRRAFEECGADAMVTSKPEDLGSASHVVLPGVGAFSDAMAHLHERGFVSTLRAMKTQRTPFLGICLGMQLMASSGDEGGVAEGLGLIEARVTRLVPDAPGVRIPHVGWNEVTPSKASRLFDGIAPGRDFYFVHSYHVQCISPADELARTPYCGGFSSAVSAGDHLFGVQFHPEKSQKAGFALLRNFIAL
jgi:glutamine amidotransferase